MTQSQEEIDLENYNKVITGVIDSAAESQDAISEPVQEEAEQIQEEVPQDDDKAYNFKALRDELAQIKQDRDRLQQEFEYVKRSAQREPEAPRKRALDELVDDDIMTGAQFKKAMAEQQAQYDLMLGELQVRAQNPDYDEVMNKYGIPLLEKNPKFARAFIATPEAERAAYLYDLGSLYRNADRAQVQEAPTPAPQPSQAAKRMVENSRKPGTLSNSVGGTPSLSQTDYYATMSDQEFAALVQKNLSQI